MISLKKIFAQAVSLSVIAMSLAATAMPANAGQRLLDAGFESGTDGFSARASETVSRVTTGAYDGQGCLMVSNRSNAWNGAVIELGSSWKAGSTYVFSCAVKQDSGETVDMQLSLQYSDSSGTTQYDHIAAATVASSEWTVLTNTAYTIPAGSGTRYLYIETTESLCDFYVDSVISEVPTHYRRGDVNHDEVIDRDDVQALLSYLLDKEGGTVYLDTADMNADGKLDVRDLTMLRQFFIYPYLTLTTTTTTTTAATTPKPVLQPGQWYNRADISWIDTSKPMVAICFDDGPVSGSNSASRIQNALTESGFHATFFYWGNRINSGNESEIAEAEKRGFEVANHTYTHTNLTNLGADGIMNEYNQCKSVLDRIVGEQRDYLVRPPYLAVNDTVKRTLQVPLVNCGVDSADWNGATANDMINKIKSGVSNGSLNGQVVLMHETYDSTATAMEQICPFLKQAGWQNVTVSEMFKAKGKEMFAGNVYNNCN